MSLSPEDFARLTAERDAAIAEVARLREALGQITALFVDYPDDEESGGTVFYPHCAYMLAFPYPRPPNTPTCKAWKEQIIAAARALVEPPR